MFVFAAYAGGLRISDILPLEYSSIDGNHLDISIQKTGSQLSIQIPKTAITIIEKWKSAPKKSKRFVFPILPDNLNRTGDSSDNKKLIDDLISSATAYINKNLKIIAKGVGITKNVSTHIARHTWATRSLRKGIFNSSFNQWSHNASLRY